MDFEKEREDIILFTKVGTIVLSCIALLVAGLFYFPSAIVTISQGLSDHNIPICSVHQKQKKVALTFDVSWGNENTSSLLDTLKENNVKASFFLTGDWIDKYPEEVQAIAHAGHDLGNHSATHSQMTKLAEEQCRKEIVYPQEQVKKLTGIRMNLYRIPFNNYNESVMKEIKGCGYYPIQWSVDSLDWKDYSATDIVKHVCKNKELKNGSIILFHNDGKYTAEALGEVITQLKKDGYEIVPISQLIYIQSYHVDKNGCQYED